MDIRRSRRARRMRIAVRCDGSVVAVHPSSVGFYRILPFIENQIDWIREKIDFFNSRPSAPVWRSTKREYMKNKVASLELVKSRVEHFNQFYNFHCNKICIKNQKTRWGSCSSKKNLNFNYKIIFLPEELQDYLIVHELCHLKELNHSKNFWALVRQRIPNFRSLSKTLRRRTR